MVEPSSARCAEHPEQVARAEPCPRCGTYYCDACAASGRGLCQDCARRIDGGRYVAHVPTLGVGMMIHGGLTLGVAVTATVYGAFLAIAFQDLPDNPDPATGILVPAVMVGGVLGLGLVHAIPGILQLIAGWYIRSYRGRGLGALALISGFVTVLGCYCAPTSLAMFVWGAMVLLSRDVAARFAAERLAPEPADPEPVEPAPTPEDLLHPPP